MARPPGLMLDHIGLKVSDYVRARDFYVKALDPLGFVLIINRDDYAGFGVQGRPQFFISPGDPAPDLHIAFQARDRTTVDAFYHAAIGAGAKDNGAPGMRPIYHPNYYGAFVLDPDGHNIEAVCHEAG